MRQGPRREGHLRDPAAPARADPGRAGEGGPRRSRCCGPWPRPGDPASRNALALALSEAGRQKEAYELLQKVLADDPGNAKALRAARPRSSCASGTGSRRATSRARRSSCKPGLPLAWNNLGVALYQLGQPGEALDAWQRAVDLKPDLWDALWNLGVKAARARPARSRPAPPWSASWPERRASGTRRTCEGAGDAAEVAVKTSPLIPRLPPPGRGARIGCLASARQGARATFPLPGTVEPRGRGCGPACSSSSSPPARPASPPSPKARPSSSSRSTPCAPTTCPAYGYTRRRDPGDRPPARATAILFEKAYTPDAADLSGALVAPHRRAARPCTACGTTWATGSTRQIARRAAVPAAAPQGAGLRHGRRRLGLRPAGQGRARRPASTSTRTASSSAPTRGLGGMQRPGSETLRLSLDWLRVASRTSRSSSSSTSTSRTPPTRRRSRSPPATPSRYDGEIAAADKIVGELLAALEGLERLRRGADRPPLRSRRRARRPWRGGARRPALRRGDPRPPAREAAGRQARGDRPSRSRPSSPTWCRPCSPCSACPCRRR